MKVQLGDAETSHVREKTAARLEIEFLSLSGSPADMPSQFPCQRRRAVSSPFARWRSIQPPPAWKYFHPG
jgi:hypothetical protein